MREEFVVSGETKDFDGIELLRHALYDTTPVINKVVGYKQNGDSIMGPDHEKMQLAASKIDQIRDAFTEWVGSRPQEWKQDLADLYNNTYNCFVRPQYDGSHQTFPGLDLKALKAAKGIDSIYGSQKDAVWMLLQDAGGICDHEVGTGKTLIMCIAAHEMKRLGIAHKPLIIGMKANVNEIAATYQAAYPNDRILYAPTESKEFKERDMFFNRMKNNDYDCIIMSHDQFNRIPQSVETMSHVMSEELYALEEALKVYEQQNNTYASSRQKSGLETRKENLKVELANLNYKLQERAEDVVDFKTMGIDHIFVDESQQYKNLPFTTRNNRVAGLGDPKGSQRARNLQYAIRTIQERTGRDLGATFLSGTTISNSLTELYLLFKYLRPQGMSGQNINSFDAWAAVFARKSRDYELNVAGQIVMKERYRHFIKVPELGMFYNEITDYKTAADVGLERPKMDVELVNIQPTPDHQDFSRRLLQFAQDGDGSVVFRPDLDDREKQAKMLLVTGMGKKASLSPKLVNPDYHEGDDTKIGFAARNIAEIYKQYDAFKGTQFVFCDLSTPKKGEWSVYQELKDRLVNKYGIPEQEIQFIQDHGTERKRKAVIDKMNAGVVRILIGSTTTLGTGVNAQQRAVAVHHLDLPWRPSDMEQRNGRAVRKGNEVARDHAGNTVKVFVYAVERSLDSYNFYLLQAKSEFIRQMKTGSLGKRTFDQGGEDEEQGMPFAEYVAITSGNTDLLERAKMEKRILGLESERKAFFKQLSVTEHRLDSARQSLRRNESQLVELQADYRQLFGLHADKEQVEQRLAEWKEDLSFNDAYLVIPRLQYKGREVSFDDLKVHYASSAGPDCIALHGEQLASYLQELARLEIREEVVIGNDGGQHNMEGDKPFLVSMSSVHEYNESTHVNRFVGNRFFVYNGSYDRSNPIKYTFNNGKMPLRDKEGAALYVQQALSAIPGLVESKQAYIDGLKNTIADMERIVAKPWEKADMLKELKEQLQQLDRKINTEMDIRTQQEGGQLEKPEELPYKIERESWGREPWKLTFKEDVFRFVSRDELNDLEDKLHGNIHFYDGEFKGSFRHQFGAEEAIKEISRLNAEHIRDVEWLAGAVKKVHDRVCLPAYQQLRKMGYDRFGQPLSEEQRTMKVLSLASYEDVRGLAHGVKDDAIGIIDIAASAMGKAVNAMPDKDDYVLVPMPSHNQRYNVCVSRLTRKIAEQTGLKRVEALEGAEHKRLYDFKKKHPGEPLPELFFALSEDYPIPEGKKPLVIDNVIDTGHTAWAALEAMPETPLVMVLGTTGNHHSEGHSIDVEILPDGLKYVKAAVPPGVGLTGMTQPEIDALMDQAHKPSWSEYGDAQRQLKFAGLDWHTGLPLYLITPYQDKWDILRSDLRQPVSEIIAKGSLAKLFTEEQLKAMPEQDRNLLEEKLGFFKGLKDEEWKYKYDQMRELLVVYDYLKDKVDPEAHMLQQSPYADKPEYEQLLMDDCGIDGDEFRQAVEDNDDIVAIVRNENNEFTDEEIDGRLEDFLDENFYIEPSGIDSGWSKVRTEVLAAAREFITALDEAQKPKVSEGEAQTPVAEATAEEKQPEQQGAVQVETHEMKFPDDADIDKCAAFIFGQMQQGYPEMDVNITQKMQALAKNEARTVMTTALNQDWQARPAFKDNMALMMERQLLDAGYPEHLCGQLSERMVNYAFDYAIGNSEQQPVRRQPSEDTTKKLSDRAVYTESLLTQNMPLREDLVEQNFITANNGGSGFGHSLAVGFLKARDLDWRTGYRLSDIEDLVTKWDQASDATVQRMARDMAAGGLRKMFDYQERNAINEGDWDILETLIEQVKTEPEAVEPCRRLLLMYDVIVRQYAFDDAKTLLVLDAPEVTVDSIQKQIDENYIAAAQRRHIASLDERRIYDIGFMPEYKDHRNRRLMNTGSRFGVIPSFLEEAAFQLLGYERFGISDINQKDMMPNPWDDIYGIIKWAIDNKGLNSKYLEKVTQYDYTKKPDELGDLPKRVEDRDWELYVKSIQNNEERIFTSEELKEVAAVLPEPMKMDLFNDLVNLSRMKAVMDTRNHILAINEGDNAARFIAEVTARRDALIANGEKLDYQALKSIVSDVLKDQKLLGVERHDLYLRYDVAHNEWHGIPKGRELTSEEQQYVLAVIREWLIRETK